MSTTNNFSAPFVGAKGRGWTAQSSDDPQTLALHILHLPTETDSQRWFFVGLIALSEADPKSYPAALYQLAFGRNGDRDGLLTEQFGDLDDDGARMVALSIAHLMVRGDLRPEAADAPVIRHTIWRAVERLNGFSETASERGV